MDSSERALFNIARERYMTLGARVATPSLRQVAVAIRHAMTDNRSPDASKSGVIISGGPGLGKTTAVQEFGRAFERARRQRATASQRNLIPVAYVPVPTHATAKTMITKLADFYAIPYSRNANYEVLLSRVSHVMRECRTELVIIDDIHRLDLHYRGNEQVADALKELSERCPARWSTPVSMSPATACSGAPAANRSWPDSSWSSSTPTGLARPRMPRCGGASSSTSKTHCA
jgi:hypothetical protein